MSVLERFNNGEITMDQARNLLTDRAQETAALVGSHLNLHTQDHYSRDREARLYDRNQPSGQVGPTHDAVRDDLQYQITNGTLHGPQGNQPYTPDPTVQPQTVQPEPYRPDPVQPSYSDYQTYNTTNHNLW